MLLMLPMNGRQLSVTEHAGMRSVHTACRVEARFLSQKRSLRLRLSGTLRRMDS